MGRTLPERADNCVRRDAAKANWVTDKLEKRIANMKADFESQHQTKKAERIDQRPGSQIEGSDRNDRKPGSKTQGSVIAVDNSRRKTRQEQHTVSAYE